MRNKTIEVVDIDYLEGLVKRYLSHKFEGGRIIRRWFRWFFCPLASLLLSFYVAFQQQGVSLDLGFFLRAVFFYIPCFATLAGIGLLSFIACQKKERRANSYYFGTKDEDRKLIEKAIIFDRTRQSS